MIPKKLWRYKTVGCCNLLYTVIKWNLTPFKYMAEYVPDSGAIYDLGCGNGLFSNYLARPNREIRGIDNSESRIRVARIASTSANFRLDNVFNTKLSPCDCVILSDFLHHIPYVEQEKLIEKIYKHLNKNGVIIIKEINTKPRWKFMFSFAVDSLLNLGDKLYHRNSDEFEKLLGKYFSLKTVVCRFLPVSNIIYIGRKA